MEANITRIKKILGSDLHLWLKNNYYEIKEIDARNFLVGTRFDIAFKLFYLQMMEYKNIAIAKKVYSEHIKAITLGTFIELDNSNKNCISAFIEIFNKIFQSIETYGFDQTKTIIPLSKNGSIVDGAHRVASAIYLNKKISFIRIDSDNIIMNYRFFKNRGVSEQSLDMVATTFIEYAKNIYIAFIFPITNLNDSDIKELIPNIVYKKNIKLTFNGMCNIISQIYFNEDWMNCRSAIVSASDRFKSKGILKTVVFQENSLEDVIKIKTKIRSLFNLGNNSIHITDTIEKAKKIAKIIFNDNSIHFLNYGKPNIYNVFNKKLKPYQSFMYKNNINAKDIVLDAGTVLAVYGLRNSNDTDYILSNSVKLDYINNKDDCNFHDAELIYHNKTKEELIYNQKYFFYFNDIKFIALHQVYAMKKNRNENKDINDLKLIKSLLVDDFIKQKITIIKYNFFYIRSKILAIYIVPFIFNLLKKSKFYYTFRDIYRAYITKYL